MKLDIRCQNTTDTPVVALESTLIAHGLPYPANVRTARESDAAVRAEARMF